MLGRADHDRDDGLLAQCPAGLQAVQTGDQHETLAAAAHEFADTEAMIAALKDANYGASLK